MEEKNPLATRALPGVEQPAGNDQGAHSDSAEPGSDPIAGERTVILVVDDAA